MGFLIGIDGGGTGCRAVLCDLSGKHLGSGSSGPANVMTNFDGALASILDASGQAIGDAGLAASAISNVSAFLGLAGANIGDFAARLAGRLPFNRFRVDTDAIISLEGAVGSKDGAVALIGTGSVFIYRTAGVIRTADGWGFMAGDCGSGARLGKALLQETLRAYDGIRESTPLTDQVLSKFKDNPRPIAEYAHSARPGEFGAFAPIIFEFEEKRDPVAQLIIHKAAADIEETLEAILTEEDSEFCMLGGLGKKYVSFLSGSLRGRLRGPLGNSLSGAVALAVQHYGHHEMARKG